MEEFLHQHGHHFYRKTWFCWLIVVLVVLAAIACICGPSLWLKSRTQGYQAVFLTNNQVYFGQLSLSGKSYVLKNIYYLKATQPLQQTADDKTTTPSNNLQLIKLGEELHGPTDTMYIEKDKIMFWENMKDDSKVVQAIKQNQGK